MTTPGTGANRPGGPETARPGGKGGSWGTGRTLLVVIGVLLAVAAIGLGALTVIGSLAHETARHTGRYDGVRTVDVDVDSGSVAVTGVDGSTTTTVRRTVSWSLRKPKIQERQEGDRLVVRVDCSFSFGQGCGGHFEIRVPRATDLRLHSSAGRVEVRGTDGSVDASSSAGRVSATDIGGQATLQSSAGTVEGSRLRSALVDAQSSAGSVRLAFATAPERVQASSSAGSVDVVVPRDATAYRVEASTSAGSSDVTVRTDPGSDRQIDAHSSAGSVRVRYASD